LQSLAAAEKHLPLIRTCGSRAEIGRAVGDVAGLRAANGVAGEADWTKEIFKQVLELHWEQAAIGEETGDVVRRSTAARGARALRACRCGIRAHT